MRFAIKAHVEGDTLLKQTSQRAHEQIMGSTNENTRVSKPVCCGSRVANTRPIETGDGPLLDDESRHMQIFY